METLTKCSKGNVAGAVRCFSKGKQYVKSLWIALLDTPSNKLSNHISIKCSLDLILQSKCHFACRITSIYHLDNLEYLAKVSF